MAADSTRTGDDRETQHAAAGTSVAVNHATHGPFTLASLLDLDADELAQPISRVAPPEHRWEQLSLGVAQDDGACSRIELRSGVASQPPASETELIPGLDSPGAVEMPVYLAGRSLQDFLRASSPVSDGGSAPHDYATDADRDGARAGAPDDVQLVDADRWRDFVGAFLDSDSRLLRTLGALVFAPGALTRAFIAGERRRYFSPLSIVTGALLMFAAVSAIGGLRPRPDRALMIGSDRTPEILPGLVATVPGHVVSGASPGIVREVANMMDYIPLLWFALTAFGVLAVVAMLHAFRRRDDDAEVVFVAHFASWFVLWWGFVVPMFLLLTRFGFEYSAAWDGVNRLRYLANGSIDGLSPTWNALRVTTISPAFHTWLVGIGIVPWAGIAYRRSFESSWLRAAIAGILIASVPLALFAPFA